MFTGLFIQILTEMIMTYILSFYIFFLCIKKSSMFCRQDKKQSLYPIFFCMLEKCSHSVLFSLIFLKCQFKTMSSQDTQKREKGLRAKIHA